MSGANLTGKLHCMADQCGHAPACPLSSRRPVDPRQYGELYQPTIVVSGMTFTCISFEEGGDDADHGQVRSG